MTEPAKDNSLPTFLYQLDSGELIGALKARFLETVRERYHVEYGSIYEQGCADLWKAFCAMAEAQERMP